MSPYAIAFFLLLVICPLLGWWWLNSITERARKLPHGDEQWKQGPGKEFVALCLLAVIWAIIEIVLAVKAWTEH